MRMEATEEHYRDGPELLSDFNRVLRGACTEDRPQYALGELGVFQQHLSHIHELSIVLTNLIT